MCILLKLHYAKYDVCSLFCSKVIEEKLLGVGSTPPPLGKARVKIPQPPPGRSNLDKSIAYIYTILQNKRRRWSGAHPPPPPITLIEWMKFKDLSRWEQDFIKFHQLFQKLLVWEGGTPSRLLFSRIVCHD